jgi:hypothetical protein
MKRGLVVASLLSLLAVACGCATPEAQLRNAVDAYASTLSVLTDCRRAGLIDDEQAAVIETWRALARQALDAWRIALEAGEGTDTAAESFSRAMRELWRLQFEAQEGAPDAGRTDGPVRVPAPA